jgi:hypothetical protein
VTRRAIELGTAGEHIVCADLLLSGHRASLASPGLPYDVILDVDARPLIRIAVKSTERAVARPSRPGSKARYHFGTRRAVLRTSMERSRPAYDRADVDLFAFVALDIRGVGYARIGDVPSYFWIEADTPPAANRFGPAGRKLRGFADYSLDGAIKALAV